MGNKLEKDSFPNGTNPEDFKCFGPVATKDGEFDSAKMVDLGCFTQDGKDSNKGYHAAIVQNIKTSKWYCYFSWGRTDVLAKGGKWAFQFVECDSEADAQKEFASQVMSKNVKRGEWVKVGSVNVLRAKPGKDVYVVRSLTTRSTGLPDAKTIKINDGGKALPAASSSSAEVKKAAAKQRAIDATTAKLLKDLSVATVEFTRGAMADKSLPTQSALDEARMLLTEAEKLVLKIGDNVEHQVKNNDLRQVTYALYGRVPKAKPIGAAEHTWILSQTNITNWRQDLDAFESALYADTDLSTPQTDPYGGMQLDMEWIDPNTQMGKFLYDWWPGATRNRHGWVPGKMRILNLWKVDRHDDRGQLEKVVDEFGAKKLKITERPLHQEKVQHRPDLDPAIAKKFWDTNTGFLFHGTRSVNVSGILRKSILLPKQLVGVSINGAMFGPGKYWADDWKKSAGYTSLPGSVWSRGDGAVRGRSAFMFAGEVVLGEAFLAPGPRGYTEPPQQKHCVFGKADHSGVANNEWITFRPDQDRLKYLIEFDVR